MSETNQPRPLRAGAAAVDITPDKGIQIDGDIGRPRPVERVLDPLYAKALVLESGGTKLCIVSTDLLAITGKYGDQIRQRAAERFGFDPRAVMIHTTQNHSSPGVGHFVCRDECTLIPPEHAWLRMGDDRYNPFAVERIVEAIGKASAALRPAKLGSASGLDPRVAFNRRYVMRDGTTKTNPGFGADVLHVEGPSDPEVGVTAIRDAVQTGVNPDGDSPVRALLLHHTCHPTHGYPTRTISADWPGAWSDAMKEAVGEQCVPLVLNGCCGNTIHINWMNPYHTDDQVLMGRRLAETAKDCLKRIEYADRIPLDYRSHKIKIPLREMEPEMLASAQKLLEEHPTPMWRKDEPDCCEWDWVYAVGRLDLAARREVEPELEYEIQVFRLGQTAVVALPGEPFVEGQLRIKLHSPVRHTYLAHMSNMYAGYIPTAHAFKGGGYETWTGSWSQLVHGALDLIVEETGKVLGKMFRGRAADA